MIFRLALISTLSVILNCTVVAQSSEPIQPPYPVSHVMTKEQQQALRPDDVLKEFLEGNQRFSRESITRRDHGAMVRKTSQGQYPKAVILSCLDSRIPIEDVLDQGLGDIFVARVAGNVLNEDILGSMEFGCKVSGAKLILVVGHRNCGAVKGAIADVQLGNITALLSKIKPAIEMSSSYDGEKSASNSAFVETVCNHNIEHVVSQIRGRSPILASMEQTNEIKIVGAYYDLDNGELRLVR